MRQYEKEIENATNRDVTPPEAYLLFRYTHRQARHLMRAQPDIEAHWAPFRIRYRCYGADTNHKDSYEEALKIDIPNTFMATPVESFIADESKRFKPDEAGLRVTFTKVFYGLPMDMNTTVTLPINARDQQSSYAHPLFLNLKVEKLNAQREVVSTTTHEAVPCGHIPTLVQSQFCSTRNIHTKDAIQMKECIYDTPYLLVNDVEKVFVSQEDAVLNRPIILQKKANNQTIYQAKVVSKYPNNSTLYVKILQQPGMRHVVNWVLKIRLPFIKLDIPIVQFFRALGARTDKEIVDMMFFKHEVCGSVESVIRNCFVDAPLETPEKARAYILSKSTSSWDTITRINLLPKLGGDMDAKIMSIMGMCRQLVFMAVDLRQPDDRDHMMFKRLHNTGNMMTTLFQSQLVKHIQNELKASMDKSITTGCAWNVASSINVMAIFKGFKYCIATGNLTTGKSMQAQVITGVTQIKQRLSFLSSVVQVRKANSSMQRESRQSAPRRQHCTHHGRYCLSDTPDGKPIGLVHGLAVSHVTSVECSIQKIVVHILGLVGYFELKLTPRTQWNVDAFLLHLNGNPLHVLTSPTEFCAVFRRLRKLGVVPRDVSIATNVFTREVHIQSDLGRQLAMKAHADSAETLWAITATQNEYRLTLPEIMEHIALLDPEEEESCLVAADSKSLRNCPSLQPFTHAEIHYSGCLSSSTLTNPFPDHNAAPRNTYANAMGKQGMGLPQCNFESVYPTSMNVLDYPQKPVVSSQQAELMGVDDLPSGQMFIVAVMCHGDYTIEDAIQLNQRSVDFGMGSCHVYRSVSCVEQREFELFTKPTKENCVQLKRANHDCIGNDGMPIIGKTITDKDVLIGKTLNVSTKKNGAADNSTSAVRKDTSITPKNTDGGIVHSVLKSKTVKGHNLVKVMLRQPRVPICGSKFCTRHGMKGTISQIVKMEDADFNKDGISPDIQMNSHCKISRMSWGEMVEAKFSMLGILTGERWDSTPFTEADHLEIIKGVEDELAHNGVDRNCTELLYSGTTGLPKGRVFMGPIHGQRLKHMVEDKIWQRWRGPKQMLTKAPTEGKVRKGAFKIGEMEQAALLSQSATEFLRDRLFLMCDYSKLPVCRDCGMIAILNKSHNFSMCTYCGTRGNVAVIEIPYATKMLFQDLTCMNIVPRIRVEKTQGLIV